MEDLRGRAEIVSINGIISQECLFGKLVRNRQRVLLNKANKYLHRKCVARFFLNQETRDQIGSFVTSRIPKGLENGLAADDYVLYALWEQRMKCGHNAPLTIDMINKYFSPGNLTTVFYFPGRDGRLKIMPFRCESWAGSYYDACTDTCHDDTKGSRLILLESESQILPLEEAARDCSMLPIRMEPLS